MNSKEIIAEKYKIKRVVVHTGPGKTGSSAIQAWLLKNSHFLEARGVYYPKHDILKNQISSGHLQEILNKNEKGEWKVEPKKIARLLNTFHQSDCHTLLLSSEYFFHKIVEIQKYIPNAEFIAYIRNPVELIESNYNQGVKRHTKINRFYPPQALDGYFWHYLEVTFKKATANSILLRPYDKELMEKGNIVADLLSTIDIKVDIEDKKINSSYTFPALEFKRLLNHFLNEKSIHLEHALDKVLQDYTLGEPLYSLMEPSAFLTLNKASCEKMESFMNKHKQQHLNPLLEKFLLNKQKPYMKQTCALNELVSIVDFLKKNNLQLYKHLHLLVSKNSNIYIDNIKIYEAFNIEAPVDVKLSLITPELLKYIDNFTIHPSKRGEVCYEMACYFNEINELSNALRFAKASVKFNPGMSLYIQTLNQLIIDQNSMKDSKKTTSFNTLFIRVKNKLNELI